MLHDEFGELFPINELHSDPFVLEVLLGSLNGFAREIAKLSEPLSPVIRICRFCPPAAITSNAIIGKRPNVS
jgi:hypothetical protein